MKVIITGATGMVGKAVLIECIESASVEEVLLINRNPIDIKHPKVKEILHKDFANLEAISDQMKGYDACFFCMGVSALGLNEEKYSKITYDYTQAFVDVLYKHNPKMTFNYVSGQGTDGTEKGRVMWARVKGKTENMVFNKGFEDAYAFRPGAILPEKGVKSRTGWYNFFYVIMRPFFPILRRMNSVALSSNLGAAMINTVLYPQDKKIFDNRDINNLANHYRN